MAVHTPTGAASPTARRLRPRRDRAPARSVLEIVGTSPASAERHRARVAAAVVVGRRGHGRRRERRPRAIDAAAEPAISGPAAGDGVPQRPTAQRAAARAAAAAVRRARAAVGVARRDPTERAAGGAEPVREPGRRAPRAAGAKNERAAPQQGRRPLPARGRAASIRTAARWHQPRAAQSARTDGGRAASRARGGAAPARRAAPPAARQKPMPRVDADAEGYSGHAEREEEGDASRDAVGL